MNRRRAFTMVELLVVIGVIAVLAGLVLAVGSGVAARSERQQMQDAFSLLDQAVTELEESRGQALVFKRVGGTKPDDLPFFDIEQQNLPTADYIGEALVELLARNPRSREFLNRISPDILVYDNKPIPRYPGSGLKLSYRLRDPWGEPIKVYPCGRPATRAELKKARELIASGITSTSAADLTAGWGIDLEDSTVRTRSEELSKIACAGRKWLFYSKGPDRLDGQPPWDKNGQLDENKDGIADWSDNVFNYEPLRPNP